MNHFSTEEINYYDKTLGWFLYPILGISFIFFASGNNFSTLILLPSFKWDVLFALIAVSIIGFYLAWLVRFLDKRNTWEKDIKERALKQIIFGIILPLAFAIGLETLYLKTINIDFSESSILNLELPLTFIYLLIINLLFYINYISIAYNRNKKKAVESNSLIEKIRILDGAKETLIPIDEITFLHSSDKTIWLHTNNNKQYAQNNTLSDWEEKLPRQKFYRINRQFIIHRNSVKHITPTETRRLQVFLNNYNDTEIYIPKTKATAFRNWWQN